jgi:alpha-1,3-mannosyltransferase
MERMIEGLSAAQAGSGHEVVVCTLDHAITDGRPLADAVHRGVRYRRVRRVGPRRYPFARGLSALTADADVVHVHGVDGLADSLVGRRPVGLSTHGGYFHTQRSQWLKRLMLRSWTRHTLSRARAVWFASEADRVAHAGAFVPGEVVPNGVEIGPFRSKGCAIEPGLWVVPGPVDVHKGIDQLIDAMGVLKDRDNRPFRVEVTGPVRQRGLAETLMSRARARGVHHRLRFVGEQPIPVLAERFSRAQWVLFPSRYEGFGLSVVEAMAAGSRVLVSPIAAFQALVRDGVDGHFVDFSDPGLAADRLASLRDAGPRSDVRAAAQAAADAHCWTHRVRDWDRAYARMLA